RFGDAVVPLDEARARAAVDLSGRPYLVWDVQVDAAPGELGSFAPPPHHPRPARARRPAPPLPGGLLQGPGPRPRRRLRARPARRRRQHQGGPGMTRPPVAVLDYGVGNLHSAAKALDRAGAEVRVVPTVAEAGGAAGLVVPGVGAYGACLNGLASAGGAAAVAGWLEGGR